MEIERKYLVRALPAHLDSYPYHTIEQAYLCTEPVIRIRRQDDSYYLTYKSKGMLSREEYNLPLTKEAFDHLLPKADGTIITKRRYVIPLENGLSAELDLFDGSFQGLVLVEVEFPDEAASRAFTPPSWFAEEVTYRKEYHNSYLSSLKRS